MAIGKPIPESEDIIRTKFPALFNHPVHWKVLMDISKKEGQEAAEDRARQIISKSDILGNRNKTAVRHRIGRREFLRFQRDLENETKKTIFDRMSSKLNKMILKAADSTGTIPLHKSKPIMKRIKDINTEAYKEFEHKTIAGVRRSIRFGLLVSMDSAQDGLDRHNEMREDKDKVMKRAFKTISELGDRIKEDVLPFRYITDDIPDTKRQFTLQNIEAEKTAVIAKTSTTFKTIFDRVKARRIKRGIFKNRVRGFFQTGFKLSQAVWDLRDGNLRRIRNIVAPGIAQGRSAISMASEISKATTIGVGGVKGVTSAGRGVAKSAFKNALRMARTETNNAYHEAELEYARHKDFKKKWNLAAGHVKEDVCDEIAANGPNNDGIYPAELVPPLPHPNCSCFLTTVIPGIS